MSARDDNQQAHRPAGRGGPGRARRAIAAAAKAVGLGLVVTLAAAGGAILHLGLSAPRRFAEARVNQILDGTFSGKIVVHRVGSLHLNRIAGVDAEVFDPEGRRVLDLHGVRARIGTLSLLRSLVSGDRLVVRIPELDIDSAEVVLEDNAAGEIGLQRAFASRTKSEDPSSRGTEVSIPAIQLGHAWVHGHLAAVPVIDADLDRFVGAFSTTPTMTSIGVERLFVRGRGMPGKDPEGDVVARASLPADPKDPTRVSARYEGRVGAVPVRATGSLDGKAVAAVVDVEDAQAQAIAGLAPGLVHLGAPVTAHAEVHGDLPVLKPELRARIGEGEVTASGTVTLPEAPAVDLAAVVNVGAKDIDVSLLQAGAPPSRLTASLEASVVSRPGGKIAGTYRLDNQVGEVAGQVVPAAHVVGEMTERSVSGTAEIAERGAPTDVRFSLHPREGSESPDQLDFTGKTTIPDLERIERVGPIGRGRVELAVDGGLDLDTKRITAKATGEVHGVALNGVQLARASLTATAAGSLEAPRFSASVHGGGMRAGGYAFTDVRATARGVPEDLDVEAQLVGDDRSPTVTARGHVTNHGAIGVRNGDVALTREDVTATARIGSARVDGGVIDVRGVTLEGLGAPITASARISGASMTVKAKSVDVDLERVAKLLAREEDTRGHLALDVDAVTTPRGVVGRVDVEVRDLSARGIEGATARISAAIQGTHVHGDIHAALGAAGSVDLSATDIELGGVATTPAAWKNATGGVAISGALDLERLLAMIPEASRPVGAASGQVAIHGTASRPTRSARPTAAIEASTSGLTIVGKQELKTLPDGTTTLGPEPWRTAGVDGVFGLQLDGATGSTAISAKLHDARGPLVSAEASARVQLPELLADPEALRALAREVPIEAKFSVPRRSLDSFPRALGDLPVKGDVEVTADVRGTMRAPQLTLTAKGTNLLPRGASACARPVDVETTIAYDGAKADIHLAAESEGRRVLGADATVRMSAAQAEGGGALAWDASGSLDLTRFPLDIIGGLANEPIAGAVSGKVTIADLHRAAGLEADLDLQDLSLDRATFPRGKVRVVMKSGAVSASARLDQTDGYAETTATGALTWGAEIAPTLDLASPIDVALRAKSFRAAAALPFVQGILTELDGRVDADAKIRVQPGGKDGQVDGSVVIHDGVFEVPQIGERFHALNGRVIMKPWGTLRFEDFSAEAPTGKLTASAEAVLHGLALASAKAKVQIAKGQSIPITVEGVPMGRAYGDVVASAKMSPDSKRLDVNLEIPMLHVDLPQSTGHAVQPLDPDSTVRVGTHAAGEFVTIPLAPPEKARAPSDLVVSATIKLGDDVQVKRDTTVNVALTGKIAVEVTDQSHVSGQVRLVGGKLEIQGKQFVLDHGVVSFVGGDPADPMVIATAFWDAPDGTRVYADFSGYVNSGKLTLRSQPALSQDEILALILFGSPDGSFGAAAPPGREESTGAQAASVAGGVVTQGLNKAISGITSADITTRVDTSEADSPRPELAVQISKKVSARLGYKLGVPAPGENPDRTQLTLDWRFIRNWSLSTEIGDQGSTSVDLVWRMRY